MTRSSSSYWNRVAEELGARFSKSSAPAATPTVSQPATRTTLDREFLPAALEIVETPPSPAGVTLMLAICLMFALAITWATLGFIEIHAVASGRIQPTGRAKIVQPMEAGRIMTINVANGSRVKAGDVLIEFDGVDAKADLRALTRDLEAAEAEAARRRTAIAAMNTTDIAAAPIAFPALVGAALAERERAGLSADLAGLKGRISELSSELAMRHAQRQRLAASVEGRRRLVAVIEEQLSMRQELRDKELSSRTVVLEAMERLERERTTLHSEEGLIRETEAAITSAEQRLLQLRLDFAASETLKLSEVEKLADRLSEALLKARARAERRRLTAPIDGVVERLSATTVGQVVAAGEALATIIPDDGEIEIEAFIANRDIGFVREGQAAAVKLDAFPFTRYGALEGRIVKVARAGLDAGDVARRGDITGGAGKQAGAAAAAASPVFAATIAIPQPYMEIDGRNVRLTPGMSATVEILTGERRVIDYLLSPLSETLARTSRER